MPIYDYYNTDTTNSFRVRIAKYTSVLMAIIFLIFFICSAVCLITGANIRIIPTIPLKSQDILLLIIVFFNLLASVPVFLSAYLGHGPAKQYMVLNIFFGIIMIALSVLFIVGFVLPGYFPFLIELQELIGGLIEALMDWIYYG